MHVKHLHSDSDSDDVGIAFGVLCKMLNTIGNKRFCVSKRFLVAEMTSRGR